MVRHTTRSDLESQARQLGYEPDREDTDADLLLAISMRSPSMEPGEGSEEASLA